jgi:pyruvate dehydrogenase E2 component (dihydrolipoamide acetyltransferase)
MSSINWAARMATSTTVQITLPQMGESVTEGTILDWLKQVGDTVELDEGVVEVSTDKVDTEVPSPAAGVLVAIHVQADETVPVGTVLGEIDVSGNGGAPPAAADESAVEEIEHGADAEATIDAATDGVRGTTGEVVDIQVPQMGESVTEGTVLEWLKKVGDHVDLDEGIVEISTDKVDAELPSPVAGTLVEILAEPDEVVAAGSVVARIAVDDGSGAPAPSPAPAAPEAAAS